MWYQTAGGGYASAFQVTSPEALGLRLGLRVAAIPDEALIRFYDPAGMVVHSIKGMQIKAIIQGNLAAGDTGEDPESRHFSWILKWVRSDLRSEKWRPLLPAAPASVLRPPRQATCPVPDDCLDRRRQALFTSRAVMGELIEGLRRAQA